MQKLRLKTPSCEKGLSLDPGVNSCPFHFPLSFSLKHLINVDAVEKLLSPLQ